MAIFSKETMLILPVAMIAFDLMTSRRIATTTIIICILGIIGLIINLGELGRIAGEGVYRPSFHPAGFLGNLFLYFFDPLIATGGLFWLKEKIGLVGDGEASLAKLIEIAHLHPFLSLTFLIVGITTALVWISATSFIGPFKFLTPPSHKRAPRGIGWVLWFIMLFPALPVVGHHVPYYLTIPLGLLMLSVAPALASSLHHPKLKIPVILALITYIIWFPINTSLAFKYGTITRLSAQAEEFRKGFAPFAPVPEAGTVLLIDKINPAYNIAIGYGAAIECWYPGIEVLTFLDLHDWIEKEGVPRIVKRAKKVIVYRLEDETWKDVTNEFAAELGIPMNSLDDNPYPAHGTPQQFPN